MNNDEISTGLFHSSLTYLADMSTKYESLLTLILAFLTVILWGVYVYYTRKTFKEIKKQTDFQSQAYLVTSIIDCEKEYSSSDHTKDYCESIIINKSINDIHEKWSDILKHNLKVAYQPKRQLILKMSNRGNSDIVYWKVNAKILIDPCEYLTEKLNSIKDECEWVIESNSEDDTIRKDEDICISIAEYGNFPSAVITWEIEYKDIRENKYTKHTGRTSYKTVNTMANPKQN